MKAELRLTDTNAASDSAGHTWGLEGNVFWWLVGGLGVGITAFFLMVVGCKAGLFVSFGVAVMPILGCLIYIFTLRQGKPPGYDRDCIEYWLSGPGFGPEPQPALNHPTAFMPGGRYKESANPMASRKATTAIQS